MRLLKESAIYAAANFPGSEEGETVLRRVRTLPSQPDAQSSGRRTDGHTYIRTYSTRSFSTRRSAESTGGDVAPTRSFSTGVTDRAITAPVPLPKAVAKELLLAKKETGASKHDEIQPVEETINQKPQQHPQVLKHLKVLVEEPVAEKDGSTTGAEKPMDKATERVKEDEPVASSTGKHAEEPAVAEELAVAEVPQMQSVATDCKDHLKLKSARRACKRLMQMRNATMASNIRLRKLKWVLLSHRRVLMWHIGSLRERNHELLERNQELETVLQEVLLQHGEVPRLEETLQNAESAHFPMENNVLAHVQHGKQNVDENRASGEEEEGGARGGEEEEEGEGADDRGARGGGVEYPVSSREGGASLEQYLALKKRVSRHGASERAVPKERLREREMLLQDLVSSGSKLAYGKESVSGSSVHQRMQIKAEAGEGQSISWKDWNGARGLLKSLSFQERVLRSSESFSEKETSTSRTERKHRRGGSLQFPQETEKMPFKTQEEISPSTSERNVNTVPLVRYRSQEMAQDDPLYRESSEWTELRSTEATSDDGSMQLEDTEDEEDYALVQKEIEWLRSSRERDLTEVNQRIADLEVQLSGANTQRLEAFRVLMAMKLQAEQLAIFLANSTSSPKSSMSDSVLRSTRAKALELETAVVFGNQASRRTSGLIPQMQMEAIEGGVATLEEEPYTMNEGEEYIAVTADEMRSLKRALLAEEAAKKAGKGEKSRLASSSDGIKSAGREDESTSAVGSRREDPERRAPTVAYPNSNHMNDDTDVINMHNSTDRDEDVLQNRTNVDETLPNGTGSWESASDALETVVTTEIRHKASSSSIPQSDVDPDDLFDLMWMGGKKMAKRSDISPSS